MFGDGGWSGTIKHIAAAPQCAGISVVGRVSLRSHPTPARPKGWRRMPTRWIRYYLSRFGKKHVLLIGYSQGADAPPFAVNLPPAATKAAVFL